MKNQIINCGIETMRIRRYSLAFYVGPRLGYTHTYRTILSNDIQFFFYLLIWRDDYNCYHTNKTKQQQKKLVFPHSTTYLL